VELRHAIGALEGRTMLGLLRAVEHVVAFARLNTYSVKLNAQELRNGKFFGLFKQTAYAPAFEHVEFWRRNGIFSERKIARMLKVELTSELLIVLLDGLQDKKKSIDGFYRTYDGSFSKRKVVVQQLRTCLDLLGEAISNDQLKESEFWRPPLFYSLFCAVAHRLYGVAGVRFRTPKKRPTKLEREGLLSAVLTLSEYVVAARERQSYPREYEKFITSCLRQTDNILPRRTRLETLYNEAFA
jgi:hypothetical protein